MTDLTLRIVVVISSDSQEVDIVQQEDTLKVVQTNGKNIVAFSESVNLSPECGEKSYVNFKRSFRYLQWPRT
jgi:hypothetical protein